MLKQKKRGVRRKVVRQALYFQIISNIVILFIVLYFAYQLGGWNAIIQGSITIEAVLAVVTLILYFAATYLFIRWVFKATYDLEKAVNMLQVAAEKDGVDYSDTQIYSRQNLTDLLQILLQREASAQIMAKQAEISILQNQINPHFLYNTLETIRGQALHSGENRIAETTKALADVFRYSISKRGAMIHLSEELANIESYFKIQQIRFDNRFKLELNIDEDVREISIPKLLVQPVIENALKHGLEPKSGKGRVTINAFRTEYRIEIVVEDDGIGIASNELTILNSKLAGADGVGDIQNNNIGLENINDRIKLIYGQDFGISVVSAQNVGTSVTLTLGIHTDTNR